MTRALPLLALLFAALACTKQAPAPTVIPTLAPTYAPAPTVTRLPTSAPTSAPRYVVVHGDWYCREYASLSADPINAVLDGMVVEVVQQQGGWTQVRISEGADLCWIAGY